MSENAVELSARADEWLNITSREEIFQNELNETKKELETRSRELREEILQNELNQTKNELETCSRELLESNVTVDLLEGHKMLLENERNSLQGKLTETNGVLLNTEKNLETMTVCKRNLETELQALKTSSRLKENTLKESIAKWRRQLHLARSQVSCLDQQIHAILKSKQTLENEIQYWIFGKSYWWRMQLQDVQSHISNLDEHIHSLFNSRENLETQLRSLQFD